MTQKAHRISGGLFFLLLQLLLVELEGIQLMVAAMECQQLLVCTLLNDLTLRQQDDIIGMLDSNEGISFGNDLKISTKWIP